MRARGLAVLLFFTFSAFSLYAQTVHGFGICRPVSERKQEKGCWILDDHRLGTLHNDQVYWLLDAYPDRASAEKAKTTNAMVVESLKKFWVMTIGAKGAKPAGKGKRIAEIGPLKAHAGTAYSALFMEAIMDPGGHSSVHRHSGPEAWYTESGETCLETPDGKLVGTASASSSVVVPEGAPMLLTATGKQTRRAVVLILHDVAKPPTIMAHDWQPKGLCKGQ